MLDNTAPMGNRAFPYTTKVVKIVKLFFFSSYIHIHTYAHLYINKYMCVCIYICVCIIYLHTHTNTHMHRERGFVVTMITITESLQKFSSSSPFLTTSSLLNLNEENEISLKIEIIFFQIATILFLLPCFCLIHRHMPIRLQVLKNYSSISTENNLQREMGEMSSTYPTLEMVW